MRYSSPAVEERSSLYNLIKRTLVTIDEKERRKINSGESAQTDEKTDHPSDELDEKKMEELIEIHPEVTLARERARSIIEDARRQAEQIRVEAEAKIVEAQKQADQKKAEMDQLLKSKEQEIEKKWKNQFDAAVRSVQALQQNLQKNKDEFVTLGSQQIFLLAKTVVEKMLFIILEKKEEEVFEHKIHELVQRVVDYKKVLMRFNPKNLEHFPPALLQSVKTVLPDVEFRPDPKIAPGGILVDTDFGTFDATIESQYQLFQEIVSQALENENL